jgi:hypothetical protein
VTDRKSTDVDWGRVFAEAVLITRRFSPRDAEEVVQNGMAIFFSGERSGEPPARRAADTLAQHVARLGLDAWRNKERSERRRRHPQVVAKLTLPDGDGPRTPEADMVRAEDDRRSVRLLEALLVVLASDTEALRVLELVQLGVGDVAEQATRAGLSVAAVRNARKRIKRHMDDVVERDARGERLDVGRPLDGRDERDRQSPRDAADEADEADGTRDQASTR